MQNDMIQKQIKKQFVGPGSAVDYVHVSLSQL